MKVLTHLKNLTINFWVGLGVCLAILIIPRNFPQVFYNPDNWLIQLSFYTLIFSAVTIARYHSKSGAARIKQTQEYFGFNYQTAKWFLIGSYIFMIAVLGSVVVKVFPKIIAVLIN